MEKALDFSLVLGIVGVYGKNMILPKYVPTVKKCDPPSPLQPRGDLINFPFFVPGYGPTWRIIPGLVSGW